MTETTAVTQARQLLDRADDILVLTGAGISAESGIPVFRGADGLWEGHDPVDVATPEAFRRDPTRVWTFYAQRIRRYIDARPNPGHHALAALERWTETQAKDFLLATQNVDGFHHTAGNRNVVELHGSMSRVRCDSCQAERETMTLDLKRLPPRCACGDAFRPDVVWFGERLPELDLERAMEFAGRGGVGLVVGTSSLVYPAAALPLLVLESGGALIEVNPQRTELTPRASARLNGTAGQVLPELVATLTDVQP